MGNHPSKERASPYPHHSADPTHPDHADASTSAQAHHLSPSAHLSERPSSARRRSSRHDLSLFGMATRADIDPSLPEARKETKAEREARRLERERATRLKERERSIREEGVDGGYLVTMGVYTGTEDFSKQIVRQMMIERRLAPFWRGLNDHTDSLADNQLVFMARGLPLPPPQDMTNDDLLATPNELEDTATASPSEFPQPIAVPSRLTSLNNDTPNLSPSHPAFSASASAASASQSAPSVVPPFFRAKAKTLASLTSLSRNNSQADMSPQETHLPKDPFVYGQLLEVALYKNVSECPICFMYYPPYLNRTRCCDQSICSECFVQIKRPDPHPPEHGEPNDPNSTASERGPQHCEEFQLVSEVATCPFCKTPEFGITYESPPFRRGLAYANHPLNLKSAMSSSSSISSQGVSGHSRRRNASIGADSPFVITTDRIRPDWAKKLSDARAHALRRAAAATALHNAAYVLGNAGEGGGRFGLGRRRRTFFGGDGDAPPNVQLGTVSALLAAADRQQSIANRSGEQSQSQSNDLFPGRVSSRRNRIDDLEELMMMEAIRQSMAIEEDRKKKEDKEAAKQAKKDEKLRQKEAKKGPKRGRLSDLLPSPVSPVAPEFPTGESSASGSKGKAIDRPTFNSTLQSSPPREIDNTVPAHATPALSSSAPHVSASPNLSPVGGSRQPQRQISMTNSSASSFSDVHADGQASFGANCTGLSLEANRSDTSVEPLLNFRSLAEVIGDENGTANALDMDQNDVEELEQGAGKQSVGKVTVMRGANEGVIGD